MKMLYSLGPLRPAHRLTQALVGLALLLASAGAARAQTPCGIAGTAGAGSPLAPTVAAQTIAPAGRGTALYWEFSGVAGVRYSFNNCGGTDDDTYLRIYLASNPTSVLVEADDNCGPSGVNSSIVNWSCPANGTYRVLLNEFFCNALASNQPLTYSASANPPPATAPVLSSLSPTSGAVGTSIALTGTLLAGITGVSFNGTPATVFSAGTGTTATATVPAGATSGNVTVTTPGGTSNGVAFVVGTPTNNALAFDGADDYVHSTGNMPGTGEFTLEGWVNPAGFSGGLDAFVLADAFPAGAMHCQFYGNNLGFTINGNTPTDVVSTSALPTGQWSHIAVVYSASAKTVQFYVNGVLNTSAAYTTAQPMVALQYSLGAWFNGGPQRFFNGKYDEVRMYSAALTQAQVQGDMFSTASALPASQFAYYNFDQGTAGGNNAGLTTLPDASGNANPGTLTNFDLTGTASNWVRSFPTITGIAPATGLVGTSVTITGTNLTDASGFTFNTTAVAPFTAPTADLTATATVPSGATTGAVSVSSATLAAYNGPVFTVTCPLPTAIAQNQAVALAANGTGTLAATAVNNGSTPTSCGTLTYQVQKVVYGRVNEGGSLTLTAPAGAVFTAVTFASYGTPSGSSGNYVRGSCHAANSQSVVASYVVGNNTATIPANNGIFGDPCNGTPKSLAVQAVYTVLAPQVSYTCADVAGPNFVLLTVTDAANNKSTATAQVTVTAPAAATISSISPTTGAVGQTVTVNGTNLGAATGLTVNGTAAAISNNTGSSFTFVVPAGAAATGNVVVSVPCAPASIAFSLAGNPTVTTAAASSITTTGAVLGGNVTNDGGAAVTDRGVVYSTTNPTPTTADPNAQNGTGTGAFSATISSLTPGTLYYVRAYAINSAGTSYGAVVSFTTTPNAPVVTAPANGSLTNTTTPTYGGTAPAASTVTVSVDGTSIGTTTTSPMGTWTIAQPTALAQGSHTVRATAQSSGSAVSANSNTNTFTVDTASPSVTISSTAASNGGTTGSAPIPFRVTFSEAVTGFVTSDVTVANGTVTGFSGSGSTYTLSVTPATTGAAVTVSVAANVAQDGAGNSNTAAAPYSVIYTGANAAIAWTGTTSTDWATGTNWSLGQVPTATNNVTIPGTAIRQPTASGPQAANNLTVQAGATLTLAGGTTPGVLTTTNSVTLTSGSALTQGAGSELYVGLNLTNDGATFTLDPTSEVGFGFTVPTHFLGGTAGITFQNLLLAEHGLSNEVLNIQVPVQVRRRLAIFRGSTVFSNSSGTGSLTLLSDATGTALVAQDAGSTVSGPVTVQRYIDPSLNPGPGYRHFGAPVLNATVASLTTAGFTPEVSQAAAYNSSPTPNLVTPFPNVFGYDQSRVTLTNTYVPFDRGYAVPAGTGSPLASGQGYAVNIGASALVTFAGPLPNNATLAKPLTRNAAGTANEAVAGWNLVANPYPAPLDYSLVAPADRAGLDAAIYVFSSTGQYTGQYRAYANGIGNPVLPVAQGFFARVSDGQTSGTLTFRSSQRLTAFDTTPFQRTAAETRPVVQLELRGSTGPADALSAYAQAGATPGFDTQYDAVKLPNTTGLNLNSVASTGEDLAIDGRPAFTAATVLPLTVAVPAAGTYAFAATALLNLPAGLDAYLADAATGQTVNLRQQASYSFTVAAAQAPAPVTGRFTLRFAASPLATAVGLTATEVVLYPNPAHDAFTVVVPAVAGVSQVQGTLLNALGQVVRRQTAAGSAAGARFAVETADLASGVYTLRLQVGAAVLVKRVVIQ